MKRWISLFAIVLICLLVHACLAMAGDEVIPATCAITNFRAEAQGSYISGQYYYRGTTLRFTNCVLYAGATTNAGVQGLDGVTVQVMIGSTSSSTTNSATVMSTNGGTWWAAVTVPSTDSPNVQIKITDANTNSYIYPWKAMKTKAAL